MSYRLLVVACLVVCAFPLRADWAQHQVGLSTGFEYVTNPASRPGETMGVSKYRLQPRYDLIKRFDVDEYSLGLGANVERSNNQLLSANRQDPNLRAGWKHTWETSDLAINLQAEKSSARATEASELGLIALDQTRTTKSIGGKWQIELSERWSVAATTDYRDVKHDRSVATATPLADFTSSSNGLSLSYRLNELSEIFVSTNAGNMRPVNPLQSSSKTMGQMLGYRYALNETLNWSVQGGRVEVETMSGKSSDWQGNVRFDLKSEKLDSSIDIGRSVLPSGVTGTFATSDQIRLALGYPLSECSRISFDVASMNTQTVQKTRSDSLGFTYTVDLSPVWSIAARYQYKSINQNTGLATGNLLGINLIYNHPDF